MLTRGSGQDSVLQVGAHYLAVDLTVEATGLADLSSELVQ